MKSWIWEGEGVRWLFHDKQHTRLKKKRCLLALMIPFPVWLLVNIWISKNLTPLSLKLMMNYRKLYHNGGLFLNQSSNEYFWIDISVLETSLKQKEESQEGYTDELSRFSLCLNAKTGFVNFCCVYQSFLHWTFKFQIVNFIEILEHKRAVSK